MPMNSRGCGWRVASECASVEIQVEGRRRFRAHPTTYENIPPFFVNSVKRSASECDRVRRPDISDRNIRPPGQLHTISTENRTASPASCW